MIIRPLNEFVLESVVLACEPSRECIAKCTYCFARLNSKHQTKGETKNLKDNGSFERNLEKSYSNAYDPSDFIQWSLRNKMVLGYANTVEPFQDAGQARNFLNICNRFDIPLFIQTKGINFFEVSDNLKDIKDNCCVFVSIPSNRDAAIKRFEPGTPSYSHRLKVIEWLCDNGFYVIGALSPYHEEWCDDPEGLVNELADCGVNEIFLDRLHLNQRQLKMATDRVMADMSGGKGRDWTEKMIEHLSIIYNSALANDLHFYTTSFYGTVYGLINTLPTISPPQVYSRGLWFPYNDGVIFHALENMFYQQEDLAINPLERDFNDSIILKWSDALEFMEDYGSIDQEFNYMSLRDLIAIEKKIPDVWKSKFLKPAAPMREFFRCLWNNPHKKSFCARHPWMRIAMKPDGSPWLDEGGNLIYLFDPDFIEGLTTQQRTVEDISVFREIASE